MKKKAALPTLDEMRKSLDDIVADRRRHDAMLDGALVAPNWTH